jgi:TonB family protein
MTRTPLAIVATLALAATAGACAPQCTCPATTPGGVAAIPAPGPGAAPPPVPQAAPTPAPTGAVQLLNAERVARRMRGAYPQYLLDAGTTADVLVDLTVNAEGRVESAAPVGQPDETQAQFLNTALTLARELRFSAPAAAGAQVRVRMRFQPSGSRVSIVNP